MGFGPIIGGSGSGGGGGSGLAVVTLTGATAEIDAADATDLDLALPSGVSQFFILGARLTRTAGSSALGGVGVHEQSNRLDSASWLFGDSFSGVDMPGPVNGPRNTTGGNLSRAGVCVSSDAEFVHLVVYNRDFSDAGTFSVSVDILPIG